MEKYSGYRSLRIQIHEAIGSWRRLSC